MGAVEKPILFSAPTVRAILDGRKTQTRRLVKLPASLVALGGRLDAAFPDLLWGATPGLQVPCAGDGTTQRLRNPWGWPEPSRLWVREAWSAPTIGVTPANVASFRALVVYRASQDDGGKGWKPSIHMPHWASRIDLEVAEVRVERLNDIREDDARAEGVEPYEAQDSWKVLRKNGETYDCFEEPTADDGTAAIVKNEPWRSTAREEFRTLWNAINGARPGASWADNPWVWPVSFRRVRP